MDHPGLYRRCRLDRNRLLYVAHTAGIALTLLGLGMVLMHQM